ncbi:hypothetical protein C8R44DRAFT_728032 [Mycena epipterygia]|nr:hypothetical protein C8R44DRAFT_728032 [Mycena epipterygia]
MSEHPYNPYLVVEPASPPFSPNRAPRQESAYELKALSSLPNLQSHATGHRLGYYPASLVILILWLAFVSALIWLLESAVAHGPRSLVQPWAYTTLPSLLITVFAQGHGAVTAMHLARVSVSALHSAHTSPRTWAEVFWISDRAWQGPVGILSTFLEASRLRVRTSIHFLVCAVTCLTALCTPIILSRAYPFRSIVVSQETTITPFALSVVQMGAVDAYAEIGTGVGSWTTALSVADVYNSSVYLPPGASRNDDPTDFFFAGNVQGKTATLPGLRLSGQCVPVENAVTSIADFPAYCDAQKFLNQYTSRKVNLAPVSVNLTMQFCCNSTWQSLFGEDPSLSTDVGYVYIDSSNTTAGGGIVVSGLVRCDSQTATGTAMLSGVNGTYSSFSQKTLYNETQGGEPLLDPLYAFFHGRHARSGVRRAQPWRRERDYAQPSLEEMAAGLWRGISYTVAGIGLLSRTNDTSYPAVQTGVAAVYIREKHFAMAAYALLAVWLLLLIGITVRSFRPTFGPSFDSYVTASLVQDRPAVLDSLNGELASNKNLREPFGRVGRDSLGRVVVAEQ